MGGKWEFPGGKVEESENPEAALVREFHEELSLEIEVVGLLARSSFRHDGKDIQLLAYEVRSRGEPTLGEEHSELRWVSLMIFLFTIFPKAIRGSFGSYFLDRSHHFLGL